MTDLEISPGPWTSDLLEQISPQTFHAQAQSPLFSKLSPEIRLLIFTQALQEYEQPQSSQDSAVPGEHDETLLDTVSLVPARIETAILGTCRRVWYEAGHLPLSLGTLWMSYCVMPGLYDTDGLSNQEQCLTGYASNMLMARLTENNAGTVSRLNMRMPSDLLSSIQHWDPHFWGRLNSLTLTVGWNDWRDVSPDNVYPGNFQLTKWPEIRERLRFVFEMPESNADIMIEFADDLWSEDLCLRTIRGTVLVQDRSKRPAEGKRAIHFPLALQGREFRRGYDEYHNDISRPGVIGEDLPMSLDVVARAVDFVPESCVQKSRGKA